MEYYSLWIYVLQITEVSVLLTCCEGLQDADCVLNGVSAKCFSKNTNQLIRYLPAHLKQLEINAKDESKDDRYEHEVNVSFVHDQTTGWSGLQQVSVREPTDCVQLPVFGQNLHELQILRIKGSLCNDAVYSNETLAGFRKLQVLGFIRSLFFSIESFQKDMELISQNPIQKLTLRQVQHLNGNGYPYSPVLNLTALLCPFGKTLEYIDLSFNDFLSIKADAEYLGCLQKLQYLDLRYNLLTVGTGNSHMIEDSSTNTIYITILLMFGNARSIFLSYQRYTGTIGTTLWKDEDKSSYTDLVMPEPSQHSNWFHIYTLYEPWLKVVVENCFDMSQNTTTKILCFFYEDHCEKLRCILELTEMEFENCRKSDFFSYLQNFLSEKCNFARGCTPGIPLPIPPHLQIFDISNNRHNDFVFREYTSKTYNTCIFEVNDLHTLNIDRMIFDKTFYAYGVNLVGLKRLEILHSQYTDMKLVGKEISMPNLHQFQFAGNPNEFNGVLNQSMFSKTQNIEIINISSCNIQDISDVTFDSLNRLRILDLSGNLLTYVNMSLESTSLKQIFLKNNQISTIGRKMREDILRKAPIELDLSGNAFICDCSNIEFVEWAQKVHKKNVTLINHVELICKDSLVLKNLLAINIKDLKTRCNKQAPVVEAICGTLGGVAAIFLMFATYRKRWHLRHFIFVLNQRLTNPKVPAANHEYDAFILYSGEDRLWVHRILVDKLEKQYGMTTHIHLRDFPLGEYIADNISAAISKSRKVIAVLSPHFVRSAWCVEEVHMAHAFDQRKLVLVLYSDLPALEVEVPALVRNLMETRTYCEWADNAQAEKLFFKKLVQLLYKP